MTSPPVRQLFAERLGFTQRPANPPQAAPLDGGARERSAPPYVPTFADTVNATARAVYHAKLERRGF